MHSQLRYSIRRSINTWNKMNLQLRMFNYLAFSVVAAFCLLWIPLTLARSFDNSKNEVHDGLVGGPVKSNSNQFNPGSTAYFAAKRNLRSILLSPKEFQQTKVHGKSPLSLDLADLLLEYDDEDRNKRFDDYGHMRFGKRGGEEQFDDYGHMRFGRSL